MKRRKYPMGSARMPLTPEEEQRDEEARARGRAWRALDDIYSRWNIPADEKAYFRKETLRRLGLNEASAIAGLASGKINPKQLQTDIAHCFD